MAGRTLTEQLAAMAGLTDAWRNIVEFVVHGDRAEWYHICLQARGDLTNLAKMEAQVGMLKIWGPGGQFEPLRKQAAYFGEVRARDCDGKKSESRLSEDDWSDRGRGKYNYLAFVQAVFSHLKHNGHHDDIAGAILRLEQEEAGDVVEAALGLGWIRGNRAPRDNSGDMSIGEPLANLNLCAECDVAVKDFREDLEIAVRSMERVVAFLQAEGRSDHDIINFMRDTLVRFPLVN